MYATTLNKFHAGTTMRGRKPVARPVSVSVAHGAERIQRRSPTPPLTVVTPNTLESPYDIGRSTNIKWQDGGVSRTTKEQLLQQVRASLVSAVACAAGVALAYNA
jgi:hypothetical protein